MIAAFGLPDEPEPGVLHMPCERIKGVHITLLRSDGSGKADIERQKIMRGPVYGTPIALAPANDELGLLVAEGIEDALSGHEAIGLGAWAAGSAGHLPKLATAVPDYVEYVTILADPKKLASAVPMGSPQLCECAEWMSSSPIYGRPQHDRRQ